MVVTQVEQWVLQINRHCSVAWEKDKKSDTICSKNSLIDTRSTTTTIDDEISSKAISPLLSFSSFLSIAIRARAKSETKFLLISSLFCAPTVLIIRKQERTYPWVKAFSEKGTSDETKTKKRYGLRARDERHRYLRQGECETTAATAAAGKKQLDKRAGVPSVLVWRVTWYGSVKGAQY